MPHGIMITGPSGAGKTTLGRLLADRLGCAFIDIDDYIWRKDTEQPFSAMYPRDEKIRRLQDAVSACGHFVMAGSMDSFHENFDPYFTMAVHLNAGAAIRVQRVHERESEWFGVRVQPGGDMYEAHRKMLGDIAGYDLGYGGCTLQQHEKWLRSLKCRVLWLDGEAPLEKNLRIITEAYQTR